MSRQQLAEQGQQQVVDLLQASKQLLDSYSSIQLDAQSQQQLQEVQQRYQQISQEIKQTLQQCQTLEQQEAAAAVAGVLCTGLLWGVDINSWRYSNLQAQRIPTFLVEHTAVFEVPKQLAFAFAVFESAASYCRHWCWYQ